MGGLSPTIKIQTVNQFVFLSFGVDPLNWLSFTEIGQIACGSPAWCTHGLTLNTCSTSVSKVCKIAFTIWVSMIDFIFFFHLHIRWSCSRSVWCWFHCSRLYLSSFSPPTKLVPLSHLSWTTLRRRFLNLLKHDMKSSMSIEWTNSKWTTRVSGTCTGSTSVSLYCLQSWCTRGKKCTFRRSKREGRQAIMLLVGRSAISWVIGLAWNFFRQYISWEQSKQPFWSDLIRRPVSSMG